jgi:hypothetical protein
MRLVDAVLLQQIGDEAHVARVLSLPVVCFEISPMVISPSSAPGVQREHPSKHW